MSADLPPKPAHEPRHLLEDDDERRVNLSGVVKPYIPDHLMTETISPELMARALKRPVPATVVVAAAPFSQRLGVLAMIRQNAPKWFRR